MLTFNIFMDKFMNKHWILDENRCSHGCLQNTDGKIRILCSSTVRSIEPWRFFQCLWGFQKTTVWTIIFISCIGDLWKTLQMALSPCYFMKDKCLSYDIVLTSMKHNHCFGNYGIKWFCLTVDRYCSKIL